MLRDVIIGFPKQFSYEPDLQNARKLKYFERSILAGMGGSGHAADLLEAWHPEVDLITHRDYGLPNLSDKELKHRLLVACSYSGNTEETIDALGEARRRKMRVAVIASGGKLLDLAIQEKLPYIQVPPSAIPPRMATGYMLRALLRVLGLEDELEESVGIVGAVESERYEATGKALAATLKGHVPVIYGSNRNLAVANNWAIRLNETGKIPAFRNVLPELNHNEMTGFDVKEGSRQLAKPFHFILLKDDDDHPRIKKRMEVLARLYQDRKLPVEILSMDGATRLIKICASLILADWTAYYTALQYKLEPEAVPMVEEFKKLIQ